MLLLEYLKLGLQRIIFRPQMSLPLIISLGLSLCVFITFFSIHKNISDNTAKIPINLEGVFALTANATISGNAKLALFDKPTFLKFSSDFSQYGDWAALTVAMGEVQAGEARIDVTSFTATDNIFEVIDFPIMANAHELNTSAAEGVWINTELRDALGARRYSDKGSVISLNNQPMHVAGTLISLGKIETVSDIPNIEGNQAWKIETTQAQNEPTKSNDIGSGYSVILLKPNSGGGHPSFAEIEQWYNDYLAKADSDPARAAFNGWLSQQRLEFKSQTLRNYLLGMDNKVTLLFVSALIGLVLVTIINLSNIFLSYYHIRSKEYSIHLCLGASRFKIFLLSLAENAPTFLIAYLLGLLGAGLVVSNLTNFATNFVPMISTVSIDGATIAVSFLAILAQALIYSGLIFVYLDVKNTHRNLAASGKGSKKQVNVPLANGLMTVQLLISIFMLTGLFSISTILYNSAFEDPGYKLGDAYQLYFKPNDTTANNTTLDLSPTDRKAITQDLENAMPDINVIYFGGGPMHWLGGTGIRPFGAIHQTTQSGNFRVAPASNTFFERFHIEFVAGYSNFDAEHASVGSTCVINQEMKNIMYSKKLLTDVIGQQFPIDTNNKCLITGIVKNTLGLPGNSDSMHSPIVYANGLLNANYITLDYLGEQRLTVQDINEILSEKYQVSIIRVTQLKKIFNSMRNAKQANFVAVLSVIGLTALLSILGVIGLTLIVVNSRLYELAIRRIYGATEKEILLTASTDTLKVVSLGMLAGGLIAVIFFTALQKTIDILPQFEWKITSASYCVFFIVVFIVIMYASRSVLKKQVMSLVVQSE